MNPPSFDSLTRRDALKVLGAGAALLPFGALAAEAADETPPAPPAEEAGPSAPPPAYGPTLQPFVLPPLGYAYEALEPQVDARTMQIHYTKHHQTYISNANRVLDAHPELLKLSGEAILGDLAAIPEAIRGALRNNVGGHVNHCFFWKTIAPSHSDRETVEAGSGPAGSLGDAVRKKFGSFPGFQSLFGDAALKQFGSGWAWLVVKQGDLEILSTANQDSPLSAGATPVLGLDVWEHAYYLKHQNLRADYVKSFWEIVNWPQAQANYAAALAG